MATQGGPRSGTPHPNNLADGMQNMQIGRPSGPPSGMANSGGSIPPATFGQQPPPPFLASSGMSMSRPGPPPPGVLPRSSIPLGGPPQNTLPPNMAFSRPSGPPVTQTGSINPSSVSFPRPVSSSAAPPSGLPGSFPLSGNAAPPGTSPFASSPMATRPFANGPSTFGSNSLSGAPRFPPTGNTLQAPVRPPPTMTSTSVPPQTQSSYSFPGSQPITSSTGSMRPVTPFSAPQPGAFPPSGPSPFSASPQGPPISAYGAQPGTMSSHQGGPTSQFPGYAPPPRMFGMPQPPPNQSMTGLSAAGHMGTSMENPQKIDLSQIPRPLPSASVILHETRQGNKVISPPPASSEYIVQDTGNCSPRYMRCTINQIPCTVDLLNTSGMQLALMVQPLALPHPSEEPIQVVDFGESGPVRCSRCKGYINPFMKFIDQGKRFICNLCGFTDETPRDYHCNLGPDGRRRDADERAELCRGTVEFVATKEYMVRDPMAAVFFFLIDVSMNAIQTGATAAACSAISQVIADLPEGPRTMVGVATFDSTIHFYSLKRALQQPLMLIVPDIQDVYTPLETDVVVQLSECREHLEMLLESIPTMFQNNKTADSALGAAIKAAFLAMKPTGGKLLVFQSVLSSVGIGALSSRESEGRTNVTTGEKEAHKLLQPADKSLKSIAIELAEYQVCVDVFITSQSYVDIASVSVIPSTTGGQVYYYYPFSAVSDPAKLYNDLRWNVTRPQGFEAVMRVRCSQGIQVQEYMGSFCKRIPTDVDLPAIDCDKTLMVTMKHDDKLQDGSECAFQCALLYTTVYGQRRIRVSTLSLSCSSVLSNLFRGADLDTQFTCFLKQAAIEIPTTPLIQVREKVMNLCINILHSYRKHCSTTSSTAQLILPEALKLLPLYTLALVKSAGLRTEGRLEDRSFWINYVSSLSTSLAIPLVYPRMVAIHDLDTKEMDGSLIPPDVPLSSEHVQDDGIYLLENGVDCLIYIGNSVNPDISRQLFGISSPDEIPTQFVLQQYENSLSKKLNDIVNEIRRQRCCYLRMKLCKKGDPSGMLFFSYMVEDKSPSGLAYVEFLVHIHRQIQNKVT
ncbi:protein transport protein Sec24-like At4g32640 [Impatiens glandulifera]|uniref:protein transport protein Sec24-like At4g32640 n=1 Tax=Impatiens glandulifera TaxID=253017 RepID=UPI001FB11E35|nr:protein transport protein Sec24-like At4g32640 [Impatiens glandulifera]